MKSKIIVIISITVALGGHQRHTIFSLTKGDQEKVFALQPMDSYGAKALEVLCKNLSLTYDVKVVTLKTVNIPDRFRSKYGDKYSADSLLAFLSEIKKEPIVEVIGVTNKEIYTSEKANINKGNTTSSSSKQIGIYGLGLMAGNTCIVSSYKFETQGTFLNELTQKVILQEVGHNLGLEHCSVDTCVMSKADGYISYLIRLGQQYCRKCKRKIY